MIKTAGNMAVVQGNVTYGVLDGKREGKRTLVRPRRGRKDNIKIDLRSFGGTAYTGLICLRKRTRGRLFLKR